MSRRIHRKLAAPALALLLVSVVLSGCAAGFTAMTNTQFAPGDGATADAGGVAIRNVLLIQDVSGSPDVLNAAFVNRGPDDVLTSVSVQGANPVTLPGGSIDIPPNQQVSIGLNAILVAFTGVTAPAGHLVPVTFQFRDAGSATVLALIVLPNSHSLGND